jgi:hypothetical protein
VHIQITFSQYSLIDGSNEFVGTAFARFERSTLPHHKGTRTVVLRILKIITPVECVIPLYHGFIVQPMEGELHRRFPPPRYTKASVEWDHLVWSVDIDKSKLVMVRGLQLLWDASRLLHPTIFS